MKRIATTIGILGIATMVMAFSTFVKVFETKYKVEKDSNLDKLKCSVCHTSIKGGKLNPYGLDIQKELKAADTKKLTPEILEKVEQLDSDKDGMKNIDEIKKDRNPGKEG